MEEFEPVFVNAPYNAPANDDSCKFNKAVLCAEKWRCKGCGWNPDNTNLHNTRLRAQMEAYRIWVGE